MARLLYGASSADFAVLAVDLVEQDSVLALSPGVVMDVFDAIGGNSITDLLATVGPTYDEGAAASQVTSRANGTIPFYPPDGVTATLYLRTSDGIGGYYWYAVQPSNLATLVSDLTTLVGAGGGGSGFSGVYTDLTGIPSSYNPDPHTHPASQISDSTGVGRGVVTAVDQQAARAAIGAGTGNGTSNLVIGPLSTNAASGNHTHQASSLAFAPAGALTATDVQGAIVQAAASGSVSGSSAIIVWKYASGAYPAMPATQPTGSVLVNAIGPVQPSTVPAWVGVGASQAVLFYDYAPLT